MVLVVPDCLVLLEFPLVELVEQSEGSGLIDLVPLLVLLMGLTSGRVFLFAQLDIRIHTFLLLHLVVHRNVDAIRVELSRLVILGLQTGLAEQTLDLIDRAVQLEGLRIHFLESF